MAMYTFAIGGLAVWLPKFLQYTRGMEEKAAGTAIGGVTALASIVGMGVGGWLADAWGKKNPRALFIVPGVAMLASIPFVLLGLFSTSRTLMFTGIFFAEMFMFINTGPCNAVIANVVAPNMRATAYSIAIFAVHFLGDIWSPPLIGYVADLFGAQDTMASWIGGWLRRFGATPVMGESGRPENMVAGLLVVLPAIVLSGLVMLAGARHLPREMAHMLAKLKAAPRDAESLD
jgi:MFS family permease